MTAIVGILNKRAAVMAADSAITTTRGDRRRIYNTATKIFSLSDDYPVGVMMYGCTEFMGIPWELVIKLYKKQHGHECFGTLLGYIDNFAKFLSSGVLPIDDEAMHDYVLGEIYSFYHEVKGNVEWKVREDTTISEDDDVAPLLLKLLPQELKDMMNVLSDLKLCEAVNSFDKKKFLRYTKDDFLVLEQHCKEDGLPLGMTKQWQEAIYEYFRHDFMYGESGLVFVGYGEDDIYPALVPVRMSGYVDGYLRYCVDEGRTVNNDNPATILPFAQSDVIDTMIKGVNPNLYSNISERMDESLLSLKDKMVEEAIKAGAGVDVVDRLRDVEVEDIKENFDNKNWNFVKEEYVDGIIDAVDSFGIDDMTNLAENFISITNLQRHMTSLEETVGGPTDVAVITKTEGFVWVKRK